MHCRTITFHYKLKNGPVTWRSLRGTASSHTCFGTIFSCTLKKVEPKWLTEEFFGKTVPLLESGAIFVGQMPHKFCLVEKCLSFCILTASILWCPSVHPYISVWLAITQWEIMDSQIAPLGVLFRHPFFWVYSYAVPLWNKLSAEDCSFQKEIKEVTEERTQNIDFLSHSD